MHCLIAVAVLLCSLFGIPIYKIPPGERPIDISPDPIPVKPLESPFDAPTR